MGSTRNTMAHLLIAAMAACAPSVAAPTPAPAPPAPEALTTRAGTPAKAPSWLEAPCDDRCRRHGVTEGMTLVAVGAAVVIADTPTGQTFASDQSLGIIGPLLFPGRRLWMVVVGDGHLLGADSTGTVWAADSARHALTTSGWKHVAKAPPGFVADAAGDWIAMGDTDKVHVAKWPRGGAAAVRFKTSRPKPGLAVERVLIRHDGVIAARLSRGLDPPLTFLRRPGHRWTRSAFQPPKGFARVGGWIWNDDLACPAVLSTDGKRWTRAADAKTFNPRQLLEPFQLSTHPRLHDGAGPPRITPLFPKAPAPPQTPADTAAGPLTCKYTPPQLVDEVRSLMARCVGWDCMDRVGRRRLRTPFRVGLFTRSSPPWQGGRSDWVTGTVTVAPLPHGCKPISVRGVHGLAVLLCRGPQGRRSFYTSSRHNARWRFERHLPVGSDVDAFAVGADGTLMAHECLQTDRCTSWVRRPVAPGATDAWRHVAVPGATRYRVGAGGYAVAVVPSMDSGTRRMTLWILGPDGRKRSVGVSADDPIVNVLVGPQGEVEVRTHEDGSTRRWRVGGEGQLTAWSHR